MGRWKRRGQKSSCILTTGAGASLGEGPLDDGTPSLLASLASAICAVVSTSVGVKLGAMQTPAMALLAVNKFKKAVAGEAVRVVVRCRPLSSKEQNEGRTRVVDMDTKMGQVRPGGEEGAVLCGGNVRRSSGPRFLPRTCLALFRPFTAAKPLDFKHHACSLRRYSACAQCVGGSYPPPPSSIRL